MLVKFEFITVNNQVEYEALVTRLNIAKDIGVKCLTICSDSQIVVSQVEVIKPRISYCGNIWKEF